MVITVFSYGGSFDGYKSRLPKLLDQPIKPKEVINHKWFYTDAERNGRIILVGDSHTRSIADVLKSWSLKAGYDFADSGYRGCQLIIETIRVRKSDLKENINLSCNYKTQQERMSFIKQSEPAVVILGGRLPLILEEDRFDNKEGAYEGAMNDFIQNAKRSLSSKLERQQYIKEQYLETIHQILRAGHKVILLYPIPEVGWHVPKRLLSKMQGNILRAREVILQDPITTSYDVFKERNDIAYAVLDNIKEANVYRVYPEKLFCNTLLPGRCLTHSDNESYYRDDDHLSREGAYLLINAIEDALKKIESP